VEATYRLVQEMQVNVEMQTSAPGNDQRLQMTGTRRNPEITPVSTIRSREIRLASRPTGIPTAANFTLDTRELAPLKDQELLVRNLFLSVDPYMRGRMNAGKSYVPPFEIGTPLDGSAVGEVIESARQGIQAGRRSYL
jgi:NADPH-dependent curcumin reductase CurA